MAFNIILQFMLQTAAIALLVILIQPIIQIVAFDDSLWAGTTLDSQLRRDMIYQWTLIIPVVAMGGNIIWLYRGVQRKTVDDQEY